MRAESSDHTAHQPARAVVVQGSGAEPRALLETTLERAGFWESLALARTAADVPPEALGIVVKPDLTFFARGAPTGTDPALVELLIDLLGERGYTNVAVVAGSTTYALWLENRDVIVLADLVGYGFRTPGGREYDVLDLGEDTVEVPFPVGGVLHGTRLGRPWADADYRISFGKNKTDEAYGYALCLHDLLNVLPLRDKDYHYFHRLRPWDVCLELLRQTPVHFALIDALVSNHGGAGTRVQRPIVTETLIAGDSLLLADYAAALKMGLDPFVSPINAHALRASGIPGDHRIEGNLAPYPRWINVDPLLGDAARRRNAWLSASRLINPWLQVVDQELFPFKEPLDQQLNRWLAPLFADVDENPAALWGLVALSYAIGTLHAGLQAYGTLSDKDRLPWRHAPLNLDLAAYPPDVIGDIVSYLEPLAELISHTPADDNGLRWRYLDGSVLFEFAREIPVPYADFVARVDISRAIQLMNDYIGGTVVAVAHDADGRVTQQAERNFYLPQPNYLVLSGADMIDVTKIEVVRYGLAEQALYWRTVASENGSAAYDDGIVRFSRTEQGETRVHVMGRQEFTLPPFWQAVRLELFPQIKDVLVTHAYTTFFTRTVANFEATYEGRDVRIGHLLDPLAGESDAGDTPLPAAQLTATLSKLAGAVQREWDAIVGAPSGPGRTMPTDSYVDQQGFVHVKGRPARTAAAEAQVAESAGLWWQASRELTEFVTDLTGAMAKDWGLQARNA